MTTSAEERVRALTQRMLRKKLYVVFSKPKTGPDRLAPHLPAHLEYMIGLEKDGLVFGSGPLTEEGGALRGEGMTILRTTTAEEARKIAERDPFYTNGLREFEVKEWTLMEGSVALRVNYSDQSIELA